MPVEFLSDDQVAAFGRFVGDPSRAELERFFFLDDADREQVARRRGEHNRLGFAAQLGTVRFLGGFLPDPLDVPWPVVEFVAVQLEVADASVVKRYADRQPTQWEHAAEIRQAYGYRDFADSDAAAGLREFMDGRAWTHAEGPVRLFEQATGWLRRNQVLLPGASVLARLTSRVREAAAERCTPRWRRRPPAPMRSCRGGWGCCCGCQRGSGSRNWSGCGARRHGPRGRRWCGHWTGPRTSWRSAPGQRRCRRCQRTGWRRWPGTG